ncbi:MAG: hypothetical protein E7254_02125 [Lachnospiraceae bacterium]|nr:hypothetical protein [Lachnospiraceae bacterium]
MEYKFKIVKSNKDSRRIVISSSNRSYMEEPNSFVYLVKRIQSDIGGSIENVGDMQFKITDDKYGLVYQWDGLNGISVVYPESVSEEDTLKFLNNYTCDF